MMVRSPMHQVLWLVRHGETDWNAKRRVQGHSDEARLTERGEHQVRGVASLLTGEDIEAVYTSDLGRARHSAEIIAAEVGAPVHVDARLRERSFGELEGSPDGLLLPVHTGIDQGRIVDVGARVPGGESIEELAERCAEFFRWLRSRDHTSDVVVVAHGGSVRMLQAAADGRDPAGLTWSPVANASVTRLDLPAPDAPASVIRAGPKPAATV
jgi:broad specificity phosphatase PhoE